MGKYGMTDEYREKLVAGSEYQDFVSEQLRKSDPPIIIGAYTSKKYQFEKGESASGIEIKYDRMMSKTGNVYIEVAEKSNKALSDFTPSGIMRNDNSWFYLIGDYDDAYLFSKNQLKSVYADEKNYSLRGIRKVQTETSVGFTYPIRNAMNGLCLRHFVFKH